MPDRPLQDWGWDDGWAALFAEHDREDARPARIISQERDRWSVAAGSDVRNARLPSRQPIEPYPVVGDWVAVRPGPSPPDPVSIVGVLPRRSRFARGAPGSDRGEQTVAANVDRVWIVHGLDVPLNLRKLERYLALAWESGAIPEVVLTKADLADDPEKAVADAEAVALGVEVRAVSVVDGQGMAGLAGSLEPGTTVALLGPSGVGKSSLVNGLANDDVAATGRVRPGDRKGRHTTTRRQLFRLPSGALLLDTPGMRELQVRELDTGLDRAFPEIDALAARCRFRDCGHDKEPGCAVLAAAADGRLAPDRLESWRKLRAERAAEIRRTDPRARAEAVSEHKSIMKSMKHHPKYRDR